MHLALDHITVIDTSPVQLAQAARAAGCHGMCLFMEPMDVLPLMPKFDLYADRAARVELRRVMDDLGVALDLAYPFTLTGRTEIAGFVPAMECAAELGAGLINALLYDRDPARRLAKFGEFCDLAGWQFRSERRGGVLPTEPGRLARGGAGFGHADREAGQGRRQC